MILGEKKKMQDKVQISYYEPNFFTPPTDIEDDNRLREPEKFLAGLKGSKQFH